MQFEGVALGDPFNGVSLIGFPDPIASMGLVYLPTNLPTQTSSKCR